MPTIAKAVLYIFFLVWFGNGFGINFFLFHLFFCDLFFYFSLIFIFPFGYRVGYRQRRYILFRNLVVVIIIRIIMIAHNY